MLNFENKVVARYRDGRVVKGFTHDFNQNKSIYHLSLADNQKEVLEINTCQLKAVFFVKTFAGNRDYRGPAETILIEKLNKMPGIKMKITFLDGEVMYGTTQGYDPERKGFFMFPADQQANCERAFIIRQATTNVTTWR